MISIIVLWMNDKIVVVVGAVDLWISGEHGRCHHKGLGVYAPFSTTSCGGAPAPVLDKLWMLVGQRLPKRRALAQRTTSVQSALH